MTSLDYLEQQEVVQSTYEEEKNRRLEVLLPEFKNTFHQYAKFISEFVKLPSDSQYGLLRSKKSFVKENFIAFFIIMREAGFPDIFLVQDSDEGSTLKDHIVHDGSVVLYRELARNVDLKCSVTAIDEDLCELFTDQFITVRRYTKRRGGLTLLYLMRGLYGEDAVREYLYRCSNEAPESSLVDMVSLLPHWNEVKDVPLPWAIGLYPADVAEPSKNVV